MVVVVGIMQLLVQLWSSEWCRRWGYSQCPLTPLWALLLGDYSPEFGNRLWEGFRHCRRRCRGPSADSRCSRCRCSGHREELQSLKARVQRMQNLHHSSPRSVIARQLVHIPPLSMTRPSMSLVESACCYRWR